MVSKVYNLDEFWKLWEKTKDPLLREGILRCVGVSKRLADIFFDSSSLQILVWVLKDSASDPDPLNVNEGQKALVRGLNAVISRWKEPSPATIPDNVWRYLASTELCDRALRMLHPRLLSWIPKDASEWVEIGAQVACNIGRAEEIDPSLDPSRAIKGVREFLGANGIDPLYSNELKDRIYSSTCPEKIKKAAQKFRDLLHYTGSPARF